MDIGGIDTILHSTVTPAVASELLERYFKALYPKGVVERDIGPDEFFFYLNQAAKDAWDAWDEDGETDEHKADMIYVIAEEGQVTIVHERDDINFDEIQSNLDNNSCF